MKLLVFTKICVVIAVMCAAGFSVLVEAGPPLVGLPLSVSAADECPDPLAIIKEDYLNGETGEYSDKPTAGSANISHFRAQEGDDFQYISLPEGFDASSASNKTLENFAIPARPAEEQDLNITPSRAEFRWQSTANNIAMLVTIPSAGGQPASAFYHGVTAEWIHERPTSALGALFQLQHCGVAGWADARAYRAGQPAACANQLPPNFVSMVSANGTLAEVDGHWLSTTGDFRSRWRSCT